MNTAYAIVTLRAIAATAEKLANDLQGRRLWEGEYSTAVDQLRRTLQDLPAERSR